MTKKKRRFKENEPSEINPWTYYCDERHAKRVIHGVEHFKEIEDWAKHRNIDFRCDENGLPGMTMKFRVLRGTKAAVAKWVEMRIYYDQARRTF